MSEPTPTGELALDTLSPKELEEKLALARGVANALERTLRTRRLYEAEHSLGKEATRELVDRFQRFFDRYSYLRVDVTNTELKIDRHAVMKCEPREPEIPFRL